MVNVEPLDCAYVGRCGGCSWGERDFTQHHHDKLAPILAEHPRAVMRYSPRERVRDRVDLVWERQGKKHSEIHSEKHSEILSEKHSEILSAIQSDGEMRLGLYTRATRKPGELSDFSESREVLDLNACPMMSVALEDWFKEFRQLAPPIQKGSVRLRVSPSGERGVWLDFANQDVKKLFEQPEYLRWLSARAFVEIGQRAKALTWKDHAPKLSDPQLKSWFETYGPNGEAIPLFGPVSGFSQVGFAANRALVEVVSELAATSGERSWLELFSGNGNLALALAARGHQVEAVELDALALQGFALSKAQARLEISLQRADVYLKTKTLPPLAGRGLLVDPPRAGLRELLQQIQNVEKPSTVLYVSCFSEVFLRDAHALVKLGYELVQVVGVDQFPFTPHSEWVGLFQRK